METFNPTGGRQVRNGWDCDVVHSFSRYDGGYRAISIIRGHITGKGLHAAKDIPAGTASFFVLFNVCLSISRLQLALFLGLRLGHEAYFPFSN